MNKKKLHIISLDVPYPADYGGVIDIFYKIKALKEIGVEIILHTFQYGRSEADELNFYASKVIYYQRSRGLRFFLKNKPYIVSTRSSKQLLEELQKDEYPILFEGLHTTDLLEKEEIKDRLKIVRTHNIEHDYYYNLYKSENVFLKKKYLKIEAKRLKKYEKILNKANHILAISPNDKNYLKLNYDNVHYIPAFHNFSKIKTKIGRKDYILYHGNLSVSENITAVVFLLENVLNKINYPTIIAGKNPSKEILKLAENLAHVKIIKNPSDGKMNSLLANAHINLLPTFQATGIKLKLLNSLFASKFCIVNTPMVSNTGLEEICIVKNTAQEFIDGIEFYFSKSFTANDLEKRTEVLLKKFSNNNNAFKILDLL